MKPEAEVEEPGSRELLAVRHGSAMRTRFGVFAAALGRRLFNNVVMHESAVEKIRDLASRGTVVYVMRHRSALDYFLVNWVLRREGLPLAVFANGVTLAWHAPVSELLGRLRRWFAAALTRSGNRRVSVSHDYCARAVAAGRPVLIFMRGRRGASVQSKLRSGKGMRVGSDYLREIMHGHGEGECEKFIVPLALFRGRSFRRREPGISALVYSVREEPGDGRKFFAYWWNRNDLFITVGSEVDLSDFKRRYDTDTEERLVRRLARAIQIFLHREERVVLGPALQARRKIKAQVLENEETRSLIAALADEKGVPEAKLRKEAEGYFEDMAADFNGVIFAFVAWVFTKIWNRMFQGLEPIGFEKVVEKARHHPIVLVPCHRSHFDYLILTYLFHLRFVSPPHIAAGENLSFWPLGPLFRAAGAYFIKRKFGDNELYKHVFTQYLTFLIGEGYTQEFFIEGGRSRTGKMLTPKLGMLTGIINAFLSGIRGDLYLVPVSIHYGRIVEEDVYQDELAGEEKTPETLSALVRARHFLEQKYGTIYVSFADPISLNEELGERKARFVEGAGDAEVEEERRRFIQKLGFRILKDVNDASVAGATSISASVMLGAAHWGQRYEDFRDEANALVRLTQVQGVIPTASLQRNAGDFRESVDFLASNGLIEVIKRGREEVLVVKENKRLALDFYKNNLIHAFLTPSLVSFCLLEGVPEDDLPDRVWWWLELFRYEFALPTRHEVGEQVAQSVAHLRSEGALTEKGIDREHPLVRATVNTLENFREGYYVVARTICDHLPEDGVTVKALLADLRKSYRTCLLLGEVVKPEGATDMVFQNAVNRFVELSFIATEARGRSGREKWIVRGDDYEAVPAFTDRLGDCLRLYEGRPHRRRVQAS